MRHRAETELGSLVGDLLADLERFRPGIAESASVDELTTRLRERAQLRLEELYREYRVDDGSGDGSGAAESAQLDLYRREIDQLLIPRYAALARIQNQRERAVTRPWQGPDLYNRLTYVALFFALGIFVVWAPFIPIWEKWLPFALAAIAPLCTPWLPNLYQQLVTRQHQLALGVLHVDLDQAGRALPLPPAPSVGLPSAKAAPRLPAPASTTKPSR